MNGYESRVIIKRKIRILVLHTKTKQNNGKQRKSYKRHLFDSALGEEKGKAEQFEKDSSFFV